MKTKITSTIIVCISLLLAGASRSSATQTDTHGIHVVPVPGKVAIDGKLDDWDLSGQVLMCYDLESLKDVYSARVAMMYDADNLYVAVHWTDPTPMGNSHDPHYQSDKGWAGDCVQLRIKTDRITHVTAWYYGPKQEPFINLCYGKSLTQPFGGGDKNLFQTEGWHLSEGAEMAFTKDGDGKGYVQEIKLPWKLITVSRTYKAGDQFNCGFELLWGEADCPVHRYADNVAEGTSGREFFFTNIQAWGPAILEAKGRLKLPAPAYLAALEPAAQGPVPIKYNLPHDARVTLAIDDPAGQRVRNLVAAVPRSKGHNVERWDGLDDNGKPVPPGTYRFKGLFHDGIHVNYVMSFANPGNPSWSTSDGRGAFYGDHVAPVGAAAAGDFVALACPFGEAGQHLIGCDLTGQRLWGLADREFGQNRHIALATDGQILWIANESPNKAFVYRVAIATGKYAPWDRTERDSNGHEFKLLELIVSDNHAGNLTAIAYHANTLAVCLAQENLIKLLDATTGAVKTQVTVTAPQSCVFDPAGSLIVLSKGQLVRLTPAGIATPFAAATFPAGYALTIDAARNVYLSVRGTDQNVKVFDPAGQLVREIGKRGGRPSDGPFDDNGLRQPGQIAIDSKGRLWVTEETLNPKRTSVWSTDGKLLFDLVGTTHYAAAGAINPFDPTMGFSDDTVYHLDLAKGTGRPVYSLGRRDDPNDLFPPHADSHLRFVQHDGRLYVYAAQSGRGANEMHVMLLDGQTWRSVAHTGVVSPAGQRQEEWAKYNHPFFAGHAGQVYAWADQNGDGLVQTNELTFAPPTVKFYSYYWGQLPETDGTIVYPGEDGKSLVKFPITGVTACGAPIYNITQPQVVAFKPGLSANDCYEGMFVGGSAGRVYINRSPLLTAVGRDGAILGTYPNRQVSVSGSHAAAAARSGYLIGPNSILGTADFGGDVGEVFDLNGNLGENYLFTADCLWIQALFKDTRGWFETPAQAVRGMPMDAITAGGESFGGQFFRATDGKVYLVIGGTDARVLEVTGLDSLHRFNGRFAYTQPQYLAAQRQAQDEAARKILPKLATIARAATPPPLAGKAKDWPELLNDNKPLIEIQENPQRRYGRVAARYDDTNLYVAWRVFGPSKIRNAGQDDRLLFKTGDCVDLMLPNERLLISALADKPVAMLYEQQVPGLKKSDRVPFASPWRTIYFDRVTRASAVQIATGPIGGGYGGYLVEAVIPWKLLGLTPRPGLKLKADFGVLLADSGGTITIARQYWSNKVTGLVNDVPGEAELTPNLWGEITLE